MHRFFIGWKFNSNLHCKGINESPNENLQQTNPEPPDTRIAVMIGSPCFFEAPYAITGTTNSSERVNVEIHHCRIYKKRRFCSKI